MVPVAFGVVRVAGARFGHGLPLPDVLLSHRGFAGDFRLGNARGALQGVEEFPHLLDRCACTFSFASLHRFFHLWA